VLARTSDQGGLGMEIRTSCPDCGSVNLGVHVATERRLYFKRPSIAQRAYRPRSAISPPQCCFASLQEITGCYLWLSAQQRIYCKRVQRVAPLRVFFLRGANRNRHALPQSA
jgi:hypothetical protein